MSIAIEFAKKYFDLSNSRSLSEIADILSESATYSSDNTGIFSGKKNILKMMEEFFSAFKTIKWIVHSVTEVKESIVLLDFTLVGIKNDSELIRNGIEYVVVNSDNKIQHIEVKNK